MLPDVWSEAFMMGPRADRYRTTGNLA